MSQIVQKEDALDLIQLFKSRLDQMGAISNGVTPIVRVKSEAGNSVTISKGDISLTSTANSNNLCEFKIPELGVWSISVSNNSRYFSTSVDVNDVKIFYKVAVLSPIFGYRIDKRESDPYEAVEYLADAVGMTPARMVYSVDDDPNQAYFDYGDWADYWFITDNKPLMLNPDGTVDCYLDPNDYSKKADGSTSDISSTSSSLNAMAQFPLVWVYRYEDSRYNYEFISPVQVDENYKAYAHTDKDGNIQEFFYHSIFLSNVLSNRPRSTSNTVPTRTTYPNFKTYIDNNYSDGNGHWGITSWSQYQLFRTLLTLISKSLNSQNSFGKGYSSGNNAITSGSLNDKGQFFGLNSYDAIKCFHIENLWGNRYHRHLDGIIKSNTSVYVKMTPEGTGYKESDFSEYSNTNANQTTYDDIWGTYITKVTCSELGMVPIAYGGSSSSYFCDACNILLTNTTRAHWGGRPSHDNSELDAMGFFALNILDTNPSYFAYLSYV